jgi:hypothetical protein
MIRAAKPLMDWLTANCHPHCSAEVDQTTIQLNEGIARGMSCELEPSSENKAEEVTSHHVGPFNSKIGVYALHDRGAGGAHTHYLVELKPSGNATADATSDLAVQPLLIKFQNGNPDVAVTGYSNETFLAMLIHRMEGFANGPYTCPANTEILGHLQKAMELMHARTNERLSRGVHGQTTK